MTVELQRCLATHGGGEVQKVAALPSHGRSHRFDPCHAHQREWPTWSLLRLCGHAGPLPEICQKLRHTQPRVAPRPNPQQRLSPYSQTLPCPAGRSVPGRGGPKRRSVRDRTGPDPRSVLGPQPKGEPQTTAGRSGHQTFIGTAGRWAYSLLTSDGGDMRCGVRVFPPPPPGPGHRPRPFAFVGRRGPRQSTGTVR
jgi:hypothetical protein